MCQLSDTQFNSLAIFCMLDYAGYMDETHNPEVEARPAKTPPTAKTPASPSLVKVLAGKTKINKTLDDNTLLDVHIGNPLRKITELLEEIKKQKAFSFTLRGSLGIMGVVLSLSLLGFFGTTHALCDKGVQTHIGRIRMLQVTDNEPDSVISKAQDAIAYYTKFFYPTAQTAPRYRYILETPTHETIHLNRGRDVTLSSFKSQAVFVTGPYDSCSQELTLETPASIEAYQ